MGLFDKVKELHDQGPLGKGHDKLLNTQLLEQTFDLMRNDPGLSLQDAMQATGVDLSQVPSGLAENIVRSQPAEVQQQVAQAFGGDVPDASKFASSPSSTLVAGSTPPLSTTNASLVTNPAGHAPPGLNTPGASVPPAMDPGIRILPPGTQSVVQTVGNTPSALIQRVFNGESARVEAPHVSATVSTTNPTGATVRTDATQAVAMPRNANGEAHRAERAQQNAMPGNIPQRGDAAHNANTVQSRADGRGPSQQPGNAQNAQGNPAAQSALTQAAARQAPGQIAQAPVPQQQTAVQAQAAPQGAAQAAGFAAQQTATQAAPQQASNRQMGEQPSQQLNPRAADAAVGSQRVQEARPALAASDPRGFTPQQQLPSQAVQPALARPEITAAQVMPQLAGLTVVANPQIPAVNSQLNQNATPVASGAENAASQARDALLAPAGHTLAGFLRRDHRGRAQALRKPVDWVLAMMSGARKRKVEGEAEATSFQWLFWILTVAAYGAIATAIIIMAPNGGRLLDGDGAPTTGAYALAVGALAATMSWLVARKLSKNSR